MAVKHRHGSSKPKKNRTSMARKADRHRLYERAVQCSESEIDFVDATFESLTGRKAVCIREDFCGTTNSSCEWIRRRDTNRAICVDLDDEVLDWGRQHHMASLTDDQEGQEYTGTAPFYTLAIELSGEGRGLVSGDGGLECGTVCTVSFEAG